MTAAALPAGRIPLSNAIERVSLRELFERTKAKLREFGLEPTQPTILHMSPGFTDQAENKVLDHVFGDPAYTITAPTYLALCTAVPTETSTLASGFTEATYTGYARKAVAASDMGAGAAGAKSNGTAITFDPCTGSTSTIIGWGLATVASGTGGDLVLYGSCTSTVISTTQTPATVAIGGLSATLD